jgi:hypothetical protein
MSRGHLFFSGGCSTLKLRLGKRSTLLALECLQFAQVFSQNGRDLAAEVGSDYSPLFATGEQPSHYFRLLLRPRLKPFKVLLPL